jgi:hypothetical protein
MTSEDDWGAVLLKHKVEIGNPGYLLEQAGWARVNNSHVPRVYRGLFAELEGIT